MNADEIVRALRSYASDCDDDEACCQCTFAWVCDKCGNNAPAIIADLIVDLTAQLTDYHRMSKLVDGKMAENQRLRRINETVQAQLTATQKRLDAAEKDITALGNESCESCKLCRKCPCCKPGERGVCKGFEWRGPQEEEKGEAEHV